MAEFIKNPQNSYVFGLLALFATMYGPRLSPKLPEPIQKLFEHSWFRGAIMFLAVYMAQHDFKVSLIVTIVFMVLKNVVHNSNLFETFLQNYEKNMEGFTDSQTNKCGPGNSSSVNITTAQRKNLLKGEVDCINSIQQWFGCQDGNPLTAKQQKNTGNEKDSNDSINPDDNVTLKMMTYANQLASGEVEGKVIANEIKAWCPQVSKMSSSNPWKERLQEACTNTVGDKIGKCNPSLWDAQNQGGVVKLSSAVPDFYKGPCALINQDTTNQVFYKPQCFDKYPLGNKNYGACSKLSQSQCSSARDKCFWTTDIGTLSSSTVHADPNNKDLKLDCIPQNYTNGEFKCSSQTNFGSNVAKNAANSQGVMGSTGCVNDTTINKTGGLVGVVGNCHHSGQCCGYIGDRPNGKGSHCLTTSGKCINLDTSNSTAFDKSWQTQATVLKDTGQIMADQQQLEYSKDWLDQSSKYKGMFSPTTSVTPQWQTDVNVSVKGTKPSGLDWEDVYYGDPDTKAKDPNSPPYPKSLYQDDTGQKIGLGCWVPNKNVISEGSKWFSSVDPDEPGTQKQQAYKKDSRTINYHTGYGVMHDQNEGFVGSKYPSTNSSDNDNDLGNYAPPVSSCSAYNPKAMKFIGTATYPLNPTNRLLEATGQIPNNQPAYQGEVNWDKSV